MKWRTEVEISKGLRPIHYRDNVVVLGSCFADHLGEKLSYYKFRHLSNPFGILFHPVPMERLLHRAVNATLFTGADLFEHQGVWRCLEVHSRLAGESQDDTLSGMNTALELLQDAIRRSSHLVLTLGTAYAFRHIGERVLVANCHKLPQEQFTRELTSVSDLIRSLQSLTSLIREINSEIQMVFTVSPVRHLRDGLVANQRSKAHLLAAVHEVVDSQQIHYFPAYELLMDELRDYRFYDRDLTHPSEQAVDFVWEKFSDSWIDASALPIMGQVESIQKQLAHRPLTGEYRSGTAPREVLLQKVNTLKAEFPFIQFDL